MVPGDQMKGPGIAITIELYVFYFIWMETSFAFISNSKAEIIQIQISRAILAAILENLQLLLSIPI